MCECKWLQHQVGWSPAAPLLHLSRVLRYGCPVMWRPDRLLLPHFCWGECHLLFAATPTQTHASIKEVWRSPIRGSVSCKACVKTPSQQRQKGDLRLVERHGSFLQNCASCVRQNSINSHGEQKPQQQQQQHQQRENESPPLSGLQSFAMFDRFAGRAEACWTRNESIRGWLRQELPCLPCDMVFAYFNDFPPTGCSSWSPDKHIWTVGSWPTDRTVQIHACFLYENLPHTRRIAQNWLKRLSDQNRALGIHHYLLNSEITVVWHSDDCCVATSSSDLQVLLLKLWRCENSAAEMSKTRSYDVFMCKEPSFFSIKADY